MNPVKRLSQAVNASAASFNRYAGSGGGSGLFQPTLGYAAAGDQGNFSTANSSTWTTISNSTFTIQVNRTQAIEYRIYAAAKLTAAGARAYVRGNIVGYDQTASLLFEATTTSNGMLWYMALQATKAPIQPAEYTVRLEAATDNNGFSININQFFHQVIPLS